MNARAWKLTKGSYDGALLDAVREETRHRDGMEVQFDRDGDLEIITTDRSGGHSNAIPRDVMRALVLEAADRLGLVVTEKP